MTERRMSEEAREREDDYYAGTLKDDYISRKAVLDKLNEECGSCADTDYIFSLPGIEKPPEITLESAIDYLHSIGWMQEHDRILTESAQPEIIRCKDCKFFVSDMEWCEADDGHPTSSDAFCSWAERRDG